MRGLLLAAVVLALLVAAPAHAQAPARLRLARDTVTVAPGETVTVDVLIEGAANLGSFQFNVLYDPALVEIQAIELGDFLGSTGRAAQPLGPRTDRPGDTAFGAFTLGAATRGADGAGRLATLRLVGRQRGAATLTLDRPQATDIQGQPLPLARDSASASPRAAAPPAATLRPAPAPTPASPAAPTLSRPALVVGGAALMLALLALAWRARRARQ